MNKIELYDASISKVGTISFTFSDTGENGKTLETPMILPYSKVAQSNPNPSIGVITRVSIFENELFISYTNGMQVSAGSFSPVNYSYIIGFGINSSKELVIYYSDNQVAFGGTIQG